MAALWLVELDQWNLRWLLYFVYVTHKRPLLLVEIAKVVRPVVGSRSSGVAGRTTLIFVTLVQLIPLIMYIRW